MQLLDVSGKKPNMHFLPKCFEKKGCSMFTDIYRLGRAGDSWNQLLSMNLIFPRGGSPALQTSGFSPWLSYLIPAFLDQVTELINLAQPGLVKVAKTHPVLAWYYEYAAVFLLEPSTISCVWCVTSPMSYVVAHCACLVKTLLDSGFLDRTAPYSRARRESAWKHCEDTGHKS